MSMDHDALIEVVQALVRVPSVYDPPTGLPASSRTAGTSSE